MEKLESPNLLTLRSIVGSTACYDGLCGKNYFIPSYQRGYRWGEDQIRQLLKDLTEYFNGENNGDFYCLQPIVVKEITDKATKTAYGLECPEEPWFEVIDGQQRLTTILIILTLENLLDDDSDESFRMHYQTRPELGKLFGKLYLEKETDNPKKHRICLTDHPQRLDIDSFHILQAAKTILDFFQNEEIPGAHKKYFKGSFYENFTRKAGVDGKSVQVIWYELRDNNSTSAAELFKRLNDKSIKLNNAELIRALFLSESAHYEPEQEIPKGIAKSLRDMIAAREMEQKQQHLISQWDMMESRLHEPAFWAFIHKEGNVDNYNCRIEYIFDLIAKKDDDDKDSLSTFLRFRDMSQNENDGIWKLWKKVELYFATLQAWLRDRDKYHKVGFIVSQEGTQGLIRLLDKATSIPKSKFNAYIDDCISGIIDTSTESLCKLQYGKKADNELIGKLLLLFNVEYTRITPNEPFFPFDRYKKESSWTLEHIHAQNSELIDGSDRNKWAEFLNENIKTLKKMRVRFADTQYDPKELIDTLEANHARAIDKNDKRFSFAIVQRLYSEIATYFDAFAEDNDTAPDLHSIANLALLSGKINSAIGNSVFEVKRQAIIALDADGVYIPVCTRKAFLKYYNKGDDGFETAQLFYWGRKDQENYFRQMQSTLSPYLRHNGHNKQNGH